MLPNSGRVPYHATGPIVAFCLHNRHAIASPTPRATQLFPPPGPFKALTRRGAYASMRAPLEVAIHRDLCHQGRILLLGAQTWRGSFGWRGCVLWVTTSIGSLRAPSASAELKPRAKTKNGTREDPRPSSQILSCPTGNSWSTLWGNDQKLTNMGKPVKVKR